MCVYQGKEEAPYKAKPWCFGPFAYLHGAWCRLDMFYSAFIDMPPHSEKRKQKLSESYLKLRDFLPQRPHMIFGTYESVKKLPPLVLPMNEAKFFAEHPPIKGKLFDQEDRSHITKLMEMIKPRIIKTVQDTFILSEMYEKTPDVLTSIHTNNSLNTYTMLDGSDDFETGDKFAVFRDVYSGRLGENIEQMVERRIHP